jgi:hypothetical protein
MREAKVMQIFEGTNQIQRMVISRSLAKDNAGAIGCLPDIHGRNGCPQLRSGDIPPMDIGYTSVTRTPACAL